MANTNAGRELATDPIRSIADLNRIKANLANSPRDYCLWIIGTNLGLRASDIVALDVGTVRGLKAGDQLFIREQKTKSRRKGRRILVVNKAVEAAIEALLATRPDAKDEDPLFIGEKRGTRITVCTLSRLVKDWCAEAKVRGANFASHTMRKTFAHQHYKNGTKIEQLQTAFGHSSSRITLTYAGISDDEMRAIYSQEV